MIFKRLLAFILDLTTVSIVVRLISSILVDDSKIILLENSLSNLSEKFLINEISFYKYIDDSFKVVYEIDNLRLMIIVLSLVITIIYFVVFPYFTKGQTIFKAIFNLRVVSDKKLSLISIIKRELFKAGIIYYIIMIMSILFFQRYYGYIILLSTIGYISVIIFTIRQLFLKKELWYETFSKTKVIGVNDETFYGTRIN